MSLGGHRADSAVSMGIGLSDQGPGSVAGYTEVADLLRLAALAAGAEAELFGRHPGGSAAMPAPCWVGRCAKALPCTTSRGRMASRTSASGPSTPSKTTGRSQPDGAERETSALRSLTGTLPIRRSTPGRRIDLFGRSLPVATGPDPACAIRNYLAAGRTTSARAHAAKAAVLIRPSTPRLPRRVTAALLGCRAGPVGHFGPGQ